MSFFVSSLLHPFMPSSWRTRASAQATGARIHPVGPLIAQQSKREDKSLVADQQNTPKKPSVPELTRTMLEPVDIDSVTTRVAAANISDSDYGKKTRRLIKLITDLRALGYVRRI